MTTETILVIINSLPTIFINFIPGYIFIKIINFRYFKNANDEHLILKSISISFIIITIINQLFIKLDLNFDIEKTTIKILILVCSIISAIACCMILNCKTVEKVLQKLGFNKSFNPNIFDDIVDMEYGLRVLAFLPEEEIVYAGAIRRYEDGEDIEDYFIVLSEYTIYGYDGEVIIDRKKDPTQWVMLNTKNISRIELIYHNESKKIKETIEAIKSREQKAYKT